MPQYLNPDNPNAGELIEAKVDPVSGMVVEVNPHTTPSFSPVQDDPDRPSQGKLAAKSIGEQTEADVEDAAEADDEQKEVEADLKAAHDQGETAEQPKKRRKRATKPAKETPKVVSPVEKAGEKVESPAPPVSRGIVTTQTPDARHGDTKSPVFEDNKGAFKD